MSRRGRVCKKEVAAVGRGRDDGRRHVWFSLDFASPGCVLGYFCDLNSGYGV